MLGLRHYRKTAIDLFQGDITEFVCDVMVTAANESLAGSGGVDGAIHRVGGPAVAEACRKLGHCPTGHAVLTVAGHLPAQALIHAVGPIWSGGSSEEDTLLQSAYLHSLKLAVDHKLPHIAFPSISTGAHHFPLDRAASLVMKTFRSFLDQQASQERPRRITMVLFDKAHHQSFQKALFEVFPEQEEDPS